MNSKTMVLSLDCQLGTSSPFWKFTFPESCFSLYSKDGVLLVRVKLDARQAAQVQRLSASTSVLVLSVRLFGRRVQLHLIGKKIGPAEWAGVAAALSDSEAVAHNLSQALAFSEQIVSEVNSVVVVVNRGGEIQRFNHLAEEYTGLKQDDVVGMGAQELFTSPDEGAASRNNISRFFEEGRVSDVERIVETVKGPRKFLFRNRFTHSAAWSGERFLVCSGIEATCSAKMTDADVERDAYCLELMGRVMNWAALVDGARALLAQFDNGDGDSASLSHAKRIASRALSDAYDLYEELDSRSTGIGKPLK